ncbi:uncharacterized protein I303_105324 [Kwoniella dejecticola CBS 10117]|uniref:Uncharacterized protein n=1 Tax=Kwoniella dejecticola CBS 10117 TaxID=1296121 RepID=A0A1A6A2U1_9TREE|nr:uncharacterized protein I303_05229 [Kwoniella dejecticola CBS 10117]OBR84371.1 hypothetical protein I303_05229 [Kwoniella dejecticola CBS 10117]
MSKSPEPHTGPSRPSPTPDLTSSEEHKPSADAKETNRPPSKSPSPDKNRTVRQDTASSDPLAFSSSPERPKRGKIVNYNENKNESEDEEDVSSQQVDRDAIEPTKASSFNENRAMTSPLANGLRRSPRRSVAPLSRTSQGSREPSKPPSSRSRVNANGDAFRGRPDTTRQQSLLPSTRSPSNGNFKTASGEASIKAFSTKINGNNPSASRESSKSRFCNADEPIEIDSVSEPESASGSSSALPGPRRNKIDSRRSGGGRAAVVEIPLMPLEEVYTYAHLRRDTANPNRSSRRELPGIYRVRSFTSSIASASSSENRANKRRRGSSPSYGTNDDDEGELSEGDTESDVDSSSDDVALRRSGREGVRRRRDKHEDEEEIAYRTRAKRPVVSGRKGKKHFASFSSNPLPIL